jgi:hypothetical protein
MEKIMRREEVLIQSLVLFIKAKTNIAPGKKNTSYKEDVMKELKV